MYNKKRSYGQKLQKLWRTGNEAWPAFSPCLLHTLCICLAPHLIRFLTQCEKPNLVILSLGACDNSLPLAAEWGSMMRRPKDFPGTCPLQCKEQS